MRRLGILLVMAAMVFMWGSAEAAQQVVKVSFQSRDSNPIVKQFREVFMPCVEEKTGDKYKFELYTSGLLGQARQRIQSLRNGMIQMSIESTANLSQFAPALSLLDMPYLVPGRESVRKLFQSEAGREMMQPLIDNVSMRPIAVVMSTFRIFGLNRPGKTLEELKGAKIRTSNSREHITCISSLGLTATPMAYSEAYPGLQQRVIEGIDLEVPTFKEDHFYEVASNIIKADHIPVLFVLSINDNFFRSMPEADQKVFMEAARLYEQAYSREIAAEEEKAFEELSAQPGVTVTRLSAEEIDQWRKTSASAYDKVPAEQKPILEKIRKALQE